MSADDAIKLVILKDMAQIYNSQLDAFDLYHKTQETSGQSTSTPAGPALPAIGHALAGSTGAAFSNVVTYPLALIITRLQIQKQSGKDAASASLTRYDSIHDAARKIYDQEGGFAGLYAGLIPDTLKTVADSFLFFLAYNFLRQTRLRASKSGKGHLPAVDELSVGFIAGAFAKLLTTPVATIVTRKQAASAPFDPSKDNSVLGIASRIRSEKGLKGFWSGYSASLVLTLNPSLTFFFFETFKRVFLSRNKRDRPSAQATFLLAAISKAVASTITYPFSLAKTRAQASSISSRDRNEDGAKRADGDEKSNESPSERKRPHTSPGNVFTSILAIAATSGPSAVYEGLIGEILKGFFSHGITMIVKEAVHKAIIQLYYAILKLLKKYPSPAELANAAKEQTYHVAGELGERAEKAVSTATDAARGVMDQKPG